MESSPRGKQPGSGGGDPPMSWKQAARGRVLCVALVAALGAAPALASVELEMAFHRGVVAFGEGQLDEAQRQFEIVLEEDPEDTTALHYLGLIAQQRDDPAAAIQYFDRALVLDPDDPDVRLDLGVALLDAGRLPEARAALERVIQLDPDQARAHFFLGVADYRAGEYAKASASFDRAAELDPSLRDEARYYTGLTQVLAGNPAAATTALREVEDTGGGTALGRSARDLRRKIDQEPEQRRLQASLTAGMEWDDNPLISGATAAGVPVDSADPDWRGVLQPSASYRFYSDERFSANGGYNGYLSLHIDEKQVDLQIHNPWLAGSVATPELPGVGPLRFGLRADYSYTARDLNEPFRNLVLATPSVSIRPVDWSYTSLFYQYNYKDFRGLLGPPQLNRDGNRHLVGVNQYFFLPEPYTFVRVGAYGDFNDTDGGEFTYDGTEFNFGAGYDFPWEISLTWLYRFLYRDYDNISVFNATGQFRQREDFRHALSAEISKGIGEHWAISIGGAFTWNDSNVEFYDYARHIVGTYFTFSY